MQTNDGKKGIDERTMRFFRAYGPHWAKSHKSGKKPELTLDTNFGSISANPLERLDGAISALETAMVGGWTQLLELGESL